MANALRSSSPRPHNFNARGHLKVRLALTTSGVAGLAQGAIEAAERAGS